MKRRESISFRRNGAMWHYCSRPLEKLGSLPIVLGIYILQAPAVSAESGFELLRNGYEVIWEGYAAIETCVHDDDAYQLGPYVFVCDKYTYEYPYHYGTVFLLAKQIELNGQRLISSFLCMEDEEECLEGSLFKR